ncbi:kinase-like protein [Zopfia rhizophila CBS 207.26]|uniref:Kinase-like protein n=1 Tax=Zopfia rhizophila CBS 207.26 TaxID=1314779 RepID=A0A6A6DF70_9PEZI|nr:kinase-like protein [Zopfia rhizophila CBS 207.26]
MSLLIPRRELLMVGMGAKTYRIGNIVRKECHILADDEYITKQNREACETEANVYLILGNHPLIANCLSIGPQKDYIELEYYPNDNLKKYVDRNRSNITEGDLKRWANQMIESVAYIHSKGVRHSDFRLDQWLVDASLNARLSDFDAAGFDNQPNFGLKARWALGLEVPSHYLPRDPEKNNTVESDLFALGSSLYELMAGRTPYNGLEEQLIQSLFRLGKFPNTHGLLLGDIIMGCWTKEFSSAKDILSCGKYAWKMNKC